MVFEGFLRSRMQIIVLMHFSKRYVFFCYVKGKLKGLSIVFQAAYGFKIFIVVFGYNFYLISKRDILYHCAVH